MIDLTKITQENQLFKGSYFSFDSYIQGDLELGLISNRSGARLLGLSSSLLEGIYSAINDEIGQGGSNLVLFSCGRWWGKSFYRSFALEVSEYYGKPLTELSMGEFLQCLKECWQTNGWGKLEIELDYYKRGLLIIKTYNSAFAKSSIDKTRPNCSLEAGMLSAFFSQLSGNELHGIQTECESMAAEKNSFIIGLEKRLAPAQVWVEEGQNHQTIVDNLCNHRTDE